MLLKRMYKKEKKCLTKKQQYGINNARGVTLRKTQVLRKNIVQKSWKSAIM